MDQRNFTTTYLNRNTCTAERMQRIQIYIIVVFILVAYSNIIIVASKTVKQLQEETLNEINNVYAKITQLDKEKNTKIENIEKKINEQNEYIIQLQEELKNETAVRK